MPVANLILDWEDEPIITDYITFSSPYSFTLKTYYNTKTWDGTIYYSHDKSSWTEWNGASVSAGEDSGTYKLYLAGKNNTTFNTTYNKWEIAGGKVSITGKLTSVLESLSFQACNGLFNGQTALVSVPADFLPYTELAVCCYSYMFQGCTNLVNAPQLPATTLANCCYQYMFQGCTKLATAPSELPATTLANYCYQNMFDSCTSLTTAPNLPATTLAGYCYQSMFYGCINLKIPPQMAYITEQGSMCYEGMFQDCSSLKVYDSEMGGTKFWECHATRINCYHMFYGTAGPYSSTDPWPGESYYYR